jgi:hypothetical protein
MIGDWLDAGRSLYPRPDDRAPDPDLADTQRQIAALERRIDRLLDAYRRAGEAYARRR